ncbi:Acyl--CoA ligase OS=Streptomyces microflavus OX=1919 GN=HUT09_29410 PE=3 SV=1 [Streptomyces microflavus]
MPLTSTTLLSPKHVSGPELPGLGGGNAWRIAAETNPAADRPVLLADLPLAGLDGTPRTEFNLRDLDALADAWSAWYLDRGVGPRDRVSVYLADTFAYQVHLTALARIGAIGVLINGRMRPNSPSAWSAAPAAVGLFTDGGAARPARRA